MGNNGKKSFNRRQFLSKTAFASAGAILAPNIIGKAAPVGTDEIRVGLIGAGAQGQVLWDSSHNIKGIRFMAVCDIWEKQNLKTISTQMRWLSKRGHVGTAYVDYKEMLDKENLDAIIVATPDCFHDVHSIAAMEKGLDVYCEMPMASSPQKARNLLKSAKNTGKLLQIGYQRRSNPVYLYALEKLINEANILGDIKMVNGQWNRPTNSCIDFSWKKGREIDPVVLTNHGYADMHHFRNWRNYKDLGTGPMGVLGSQQLDVYRWFLGAELENITANGVKIFQNRDFSDNIMALMQFKSKTDTIQASYQICSNSSFDRYYENFLGDQSSLKISECRSLCQLILECDAGYETWDKWIKKGYINHVFAVSTPEVPFPLNSHMETTAAISPKLTVPYHQPHLQNFFDAMKGKASLNCPGEEGYKTALMTLKINEAVQSGEKITMKPQEYEI
ncbi:MAG: Gfo/Idh/MocA family oxidoreductase [Phycisphaerae bacterium]|nr:Gfo/Idh/MocA family oxidoreductase [Phycisphaerae bacterium]